MDLQCNMLVASSELLPGRLYLAVYKGEHIPQSNQTVHYFSIDEDLVYESFFNDFGPLNICMLYRYCQKLNRKLSSNLHTRKKIIHYTSVDGAKRLNAAFLFGAYAIIYHMKTPEEAFSLLNTGPAYIEFCDASYGTLSYTITLQNCLHALAKAKNSGFFNFDDFDAEEYEYYERVEYGDLNWILPNKFLAFCGPHNRSKIDNGYPCHAPETYFTYFRQNGITTIIRLNLKLYNASRFSNAGFEHKELFFTDGSKPSDLILNKFLDICESTCGGVAVHCKAGLGRTGSLIGAYIMKHYKFTAREAIAWLRLCRPGSVIGHQQEWMEEKQDQLWIAGVEFYKNKERPTPSNFGIYSIKRELSTECLLLKYKYINAQPSETQSKHSNISPVPKFKDRVKNISHKVDSLNINDNSLFKPKEKNWHNTTANQIASNETGIAKCDHTRYAATMANEEYTDNMQYNDKNITQGDTLNQIKALRLKSTRNFNISDQELKGEDKNGNKKSKTLPSKLPTSGTSTSRSNRFCTIEKAFKQNTSEGSSHCQSQLEKNQPQNSEQMDSEGNILNNNNAVTKIPCNKFLNRTDDLYGRVNASSSCCTRINGYEKITSSILSQADCNSITKSRILNRSRLTSNDITNSTKIKNTSKRGSSSTRKSMDKLYALASTRNINKTMLDDKNSNYNDSNILLKKVSSKESSLECNSDKCNINDLMSNGRSELTSSYMLRRGKRTLSSTRQKHEQTYDNSIKVLKKQTTTRSISKANASVQNPIKMVTTELCLNKKAISKTKESNLLSSTQRTSPIRSVSKSDIPQNHIVLRLRKR